jgi:hypothetical protein
MDLVAGDYLITGRSQDRVRVDWSARDADALSHVQVRAELRDRELKISTDGASAFQIFKGGLFRSFDWTGKGSYRLHAHLMAGDLYLYSKTDDSR